MDIRTIIETNNEVEKSINSILADTVSKNPHICRFFPIKHYLQSCVSLDGLHEEHGDIYYTEYPYELKHPITKLSVLLRCEIADKLEKILKDENFQSEQYKRLFAFLSNPIAFNSETGEHILNYLNSGPFPNRVIINNDIFYVHSTKIVQVEFAFGKNSTPFTKHDIIISIAGVYYKLNYTAWCEGIDKLDISFNTIKELTSYTPESYTVKTV